MVGVRCEIRRAPHRHGQWSVSGVNSAVQDCRHQVVTRQSDEHDRHPRTTSTWAAIQSVTGIHEKLWPRSSSSCRVCTTVVDPMTIRSWKMYKSDIAKYGATAGCPGCKAIQSNKPSQNHNVQCRTRIEEAITETEEGTIRLTRAILRRDAPQPPEPAGQGGGEREIPPVPHDVENVRRDSSEPRPPIPARDEMNENMDDLLAWESAHGPRDGLPASWPGFCDQPAGWTPQT